MNAITGAGRCGVTSLWLALAAFLSAVSGIVILAVAPMSARSTACGWWMPQTCADFADRMDVLDLIRKDEPRIAWKLMLTLLPGDHETLNPSQKPRKKRKERLIL